MKIYNDIHLHSGINYVTPSQKYEQKDIEILNNRSITYQKAMKNNPKRWSMKKTRDFTPTGSTTVGTKSNSKGEKTKAA